MMGKLDTVVLGAEVEFIARPLVKPLRLSSGEISEVTEAQVVVRVRAGGREATGRGSIYLSDLWAWPDPALDHETRDAVLRELCEGIASDLPALCGGVAAHPLVLGLRLHHSVCDKSAPPILARAMCASPFDAAIHDAVGIALERSAFDLYEEYMPLPGADSYFGGKASAAIRQMIEAPRTKLDAWWIVGSSGSLEEDVMPWVKKRNLKGAQSGYAS